jgi:universal stress protein F
MFRKILVPADLSDRNGPAVALATELVGTSNDGKVCLLHVIETIPGFTLEEEQDFYRRLEKAARKHLAALAETPEKSAVPFEARVAYGARARTILGVAKELEADLIVIQSHRVEPGSSAQGFGTLSYQIGIFASCPVLLVK